MLHDCISLLCDDCELIISEDVIKTAFGLSKREVVAEFDKDGVMSYKKLTMVEFLEFLIRIAELYFEGSEMEQLELHEKLEQLLDELLPVIESKRVK